MEEGDSGAYVLSLSTPPTDNVTLHVQANDTVTSVLTSSFVFTPANWNQSQVLQLQGVDDNIILASPYAGRVAVQGSSQDPRYTFNPILLVILLADTDKGRLGKERK